MFLKQTYKYSTCDTFPFTFYSFLLQVYKSTLYCLHAIQQYIENPVNKTKILNTLNKI